MTNNYAKLTHNTLSPAPTQVQLGENFVINPTGEQLAALGYKPVVYPPENPDVPVDDTPKRAVYTEDDTQIYVSFVDAEPEVTNPEDQRRAAYEAEADQYILAYNGYLMEGNQAAADEQLQLYLNKKQEIRNLYPNETI